MVCHLTRRRPVRARRNIFCTTARTPHVYADFRHAAGRAKSGYQCWQRNDGVMPAAIAPAKDIDGFTGQIAQRRLMPGIVLFAKQGAFDAAHNRSPIPSISMPRMALEHIRNIIPGQYPSMGRNEPGKPVEYFEDIHQRPVLFDFLATVEHGVIAILAGIGFGYRKQR